MQDSVRQALTVASHLPAGRAGPQGMLPAVEFPAAVGYAEVTDTDRRQLLLMYGVGAHSMVLQVLNRPEPGGELVLVGRLFNGVGASFEVADFDNDGYIEIGTLTYDLEREPDRSFAEACLQPVYYRWSGETGAIEQDELVDEDRWRAVLGGFEEVGRGATWDPLNDEREPNGRPPPEIDRFLRQPSWMIALPHA